MADQFLITPYKVRSAGTDVPPEEIQTAINSLAQQTTAALNSVASDPSGPAGGDLGGTYPNPTVVGVHAVGGTMSGVAITGGSIASTTVNNTPIGATTPSTVAATSVFAGGGAVPAVTATGTQVYNSPNPTVQFIDSIRSANNKNAFITWGSTVLAFGFANDAFTGFTNALAITGGQAAGISGITSTSGSGAWAHTGGFSATGGINSTNVGATTPGTGAFTTLTSTGGAFNGTVGATTPSTGAFTTLTASTAIGVASGGTGAATLTAHGVLLGEGTSPVVATAVGTTGQMLIGVTGADPAFGNTISTLTATGTITPSSTNGIVGTTTNDNANAGSIGEFVTAQASGVSLVTSNTPVNVTSISLTAGDWDVQGNIAFTVTAGTLTNLFSAVSTTSATLPTFLSGDLAQVGYTQPSLAADTLAAPVQRISIASTTTVYLVASAIWSSATATVAGRIRARRVR